MFKAYYLKFMSKIILLFFFLFSLNLYSQGKDYKPKTVIRIISENDFWLFNQRTDMFYTQGLKIEYLQDLPDDSKFSQWWPFLLGNKTQNILGYSIGQNLYTSSDIEVPTIIEKDRPYGAWLYFAYSLISNNESKKQRITSDMYLGVLGPIALGEEVQSNWHQLINSPDPKGWSNQVKNDIGINLNLKYEKGLVSYFRKNLAFDFVPNLEVKTGTVFNILAVGSTTRLNLFNSSTYFHDALGQGDIPSLYKSLGNNDQIARPCFFKSFKSSSFSMFVSNSGNLVIWNAMLQGGIFSQDSPYLIQPNELNRFYFDLDYGITYSNPYFNLTYSRSFRTKEFKQQFRNHQWGKVQLLIKI